MRIFTIVYVAATLAFSLITVFLQVFPATIVIDWVLDSNGEFYIIVAAGILWLMTLLPLFIGLAIYTLIVSIKQSNVQLEYNQPGIIIRRDKSFYGALFPIDILVDGKRMGSVTIGKAQQIVLPQGKYRIKIKAVGKSCETTLILKEDKSPVFDIGFKSGGVMYLDDTSI